MEIPTTPATDLAGKHAFITGGSRGIGLAAAAALSQAGAAVTLAARGLEDLEEAAAALRHEGRDARTLQLDVTDVTAVQEAVARQGPFDVLVNNAGTNRPKPFMEVSEEDYDAVLSLNLRAAYFMAQSVARSLIDAGKPGSIINVCSQMGHVGSANRSIYCASKWGLEGMTKSISVELAKHGIRVNTICPTFLETPMTRPFFENAAFKADVLNRIKFGRLGQVEELMGAFVFLASDSSSLMTGSSLVLDGGWTAD